LNPYILLTVAILSMLLNAYYMGRVWLLKKMYEIASLGYEAVYNEGFKYYVLYMRKKLDNDFPQDHLAKLWSSIVIELTANRKMQNNDKRI